MTIDELQQVAQNFSKELKTANTGKKTSLPYILHKLPDSPLVENGEIFQVMVIGGTIFREALVKKVGGKLKIIKKREKFQPPFYSQFDLMSYVEKELNPSISVLALNFAYPMKPVFEKGRLDGVLLAGTKENTFGDMVGKKVGHEIEQMVLEKHKRKITVSVANDTICLLLSGLTKYSWEHLAAGIVGTGINFAFFLNKTTAVNLEAANFDKFPQTPEGKRIDKASSAPGRALFEKETSGAYLYKHFNLLYDKTFETKKLNSTQELDQTAQLHFPKASETARMILTRSAEFVSTQIVGLTEFKNKGLIFVVEGSLFWLADGYRHQIKALVKKLSPRFQTSFTKVNHSTIVGAAKLVS